MGRHDNADAQPEQRLIIVSNRLPVTARTTESDVCIVPSDGGLATALRPWHERSDALWIGWPGEMSAATDAQRHRVDKGLRERRIVPVHLSGDHIDRYYNGFANRVLWPLFHHLIDRLPIDAAGWDAYQEVNDAFADVVAQEYRPNDTIWVHDYHLMLLPALLRQRLPDARVDGWRTSRSHSGPNTGSGTGRIGALAGMPRSR